VLVLDINRRERSLKTGVDLTKIAETAVNAEAE
jgi:hypothetical protein